jgi:large subunit ribosomal protein L2
MKKYKATTPSRRNMATSDYSSLAKKKPEKKLVKIVKKKAGRSSSGRISVRHRGGGNKRLYRMINFSQECLDRPAKVIALEYDPYRTAFIALLEYEDKKKSYLLAPKGLSVGDEVIVAEKTPIAPGNRMKLENIPVGTMVYNIEIEPERGGKLIRSAGASAQIMAQEDKYTLLKMPSGEIRKILARCFASIGEVSNSEHRFTKKGKAGKSRWLGKRPAVRGSAMAVVDHAHGGGEGKTSIGLKYPKTPWGKHALGVRTRNKKKWTNKLIVQRRKKKKRK